MEEIKLSHLDETILHDTCENGLEIYMWHNPKAEHYFATLNVKYGSIDTEFSINKNKDSYVVPEGIAHFLEHVKFEQPGETTAHEFFSKTGANPNAFTTFDYTSYLIFASTEFNKNLNYLLDYVMTPYFTKEINEKEQGIIIEEINMYKDVPGRVMSFLKNKVVYQKDKIRNDILGTEESVKSITVEDLNLVYNTFYHPKNMFVVITGNFNPEEAATLIKENQSKKKFPKWKNPIKIYEKEPVKVTENYAEIYQNIKTPRVDITFKMNRKNFKKMDNLLLQIYISTILKAKFGRTSDLNDELILNQLITQNIGYGIRVKNDYVAISLKAETNYPNEIIKKFKEQIKKIKISENALRRTKKICIANNIMSYDDIEYVNSIIQDDLIVYEKIVADMYDIYNSLDINVVKEIIKGFETDNYSVVIAFPNEDKKTDE